MPTNAAQHMVPLARFVTARQMRAPLMCCFILTIIAAMDMESFVELVETMVLQQTYPGLDGRSLKLGLPASVNKEPAGFFASALEQPSVVARLAALRWFCERPGDARGFLHQIGARLADADEWVRLEAVRVIGRVERVGEDLAVRVSGMLEDPDAEVRKQAAKTLGKIGLAPEPVLEALRKAAADPEPEVRFKAQKALRLIGK